MGNYKSAGSVKNLLKGGGGGVWTVAFLPHHYGTSPSIRCGRSNCPGWSIDMAVEAGVSKACLGFDCGAAIEAGSVLKDNGSPQDPPAWGWTLHLGASAVKEKIASAGVVPTFAVEWAFDITK